MRDQAPASVSVRPTEVTESITAPHDSSHGRKQRRSACGRVGCGGRVLFTTDGSGSLVKVCSGCARNARGLCQDCPKHIEQPLEGRRRARCVECARRWNSLENMRRQRQDREERNAYVRAWYRRHLERMRAYHRGRAAAKYQRQKLAILRRERRVA